MVINCINWNIHIDGRTLLGFSGENNTEDLFVLPSPMEDYTYIIDYKNGNQSAFIPLEKTEYHGNPALHILLTSGQIGASGRAEMQLV